MAHVNCAKCGAEMDVDSDRGQEYHLIPSPGVDVTTEDGVVLYTDAALQHPVCPVDAPSS